MNDKTRSALKMNKIKKNNKALVPTKAKLPVSKKMYEIAEVVLKEGLLDEALSLVPGAPTIMKLKSTEAKQKERKRIQNLAAATETMGYETSGELKVFIEDFENNPSNPPILEDILDVLLESRNSLRSKVFFNFLKNWDNLPFYQRQHFEDIKETLLSLDYDTLMVIDEVAKNFVCPEAGEYQHAVRYEKGPLHIRKLTKAGFNANSSMDFQSTPLFRRILELAFDLDASQYNKKIDFWRGSNETPYWY